MSIPMEAVVEEPLREVAPPPPVFTSLDEINMSLVSHPHTNGVSAHESCNEVENTGSDNVTKVDIINSSNGTMKDETTPSTNSSENLPYITSASCGTTNEPHLDKVKAKPEEQLPLSGEVTDSENVSFETVVEVEQEATLFAHQINKPQDSDVTHSMLSQLQGQDLDEALKSANESEQNQNNNTLSKQEVFNKEELLDILEGNDADTSTANSSEVEIALKQLSELVKKPKRKYSKSNTKNVKQMAEIVISGIEIPSKDVPNETPKDVVKELVKDWDDDDHDSKTKESNNEEPQESAPTSNQEDNIHQGSSECEIKPESNKNTELDASEGDAKPHRRLGRVIKKKVIFDPDNPDTFTKGQKVPKNKEITDTNQAIIKKAKTDLVIQRSKSKSPTTKMQWKKPTPKSQTKYNKRLSEVDKLLSDEGAVNMIYQLTPEAPKGRKNMRTKAEFIKKIQSSTPEAKEMKFRERKKVEEGEAKKILGSKQRGSLSGSVKSFTAADDFEAHSADDSIIYRRHSSSSYSSTCMSPMRVSELDNTGVGQNTEIHTTDADNTQYENIINLNGTTDKDIFMKEEPVKEMIDKSDCLSLKQKLNTKLSNVLNKRKRETMKTEKAAKHKKVASKQNNVQQSQYKSLSVSINNSVAEICIYQQYCSHVTKYNNETLKELASALEHINTMANISVTLLRSESGTLYSFLDTVPLLDNNMEKRTNYACEITGNVKLLLGSMVNHRKLLVCAINGPCIGLGLAIVLLSEVVLASDQSTFAVSINPKMPVMPGLAILTCNSKGLQQVLVNDLVMCGRQLSAHEARQFGVVTQTLWPTKFYEQLTMFVQDIASQPIQNTLLKKKMLNINQQRRAELLECLNAEQDLIVEYWTSVEGQESLRGSSDTQAL